MFASKLERAILETLVYSDVFDYPLKVDELHRYLQIRANMDELWIRLDALRGSIDQRDGFYFLAGREKLVEIRKRRELRSRKLLPHALRYGRILGLLPFVRMAALTGSLAVMNVSGNVDFDYMLVAEKGRVWTARAFALLFNRAANLFGHMLCPNLIVSESALEWGQHDLYSARELCQMLPITGGDVYQRLMKANEWVKEFLPNIKQTTEVSKASVVLLQKLLALAEWVLRGKLGDRLERWEMNRKIARFSKQEGFGEETVFNAEICQGNFDHHGKKTREVLGEKLNSILAPAAVPGGEVFENPAPRTAIEEYRS